ncbi:hypothetical protein Nepgr_011590 [Nepenthes gracilis]|uniref:Uncharacterized protein n=1 Tax=Nepenthes gracilis TaxID=150966 RepID=A0AAD3XMF7_NEPGR|nr:hypothetical protein Nepgr_011590 [Nepenthes gracilis]
MPSQLVESVPIQATYAACSSVSVGDGSEDDGVLSGSMNDEHANVVTTTDLPVLDVGAPCVADHVAGSLHRPQTTLETVPIEDESKGAHQPSMFAGLNSISNPCHHNQIDGSSGEAISDEFGLIPGVDVSTPESIARIARKSRCEACDLGHGIVHARPVPRSSSAMLLWECGYFVRGLVAAILLILPAIRSLMPV